jgi:hypothetical protein
MPPMHAPRARPVARWRRSAWYPDLASGAVCADPPLGDSNIEAGSRRVQITRPVIRAYPDPASEPSG